MNQNTAIAIILDRSSSMSSCREATIEGFNSTLAEQKALPGEASLTLAVFSTSVEIVRSFAPIRDVKALTHESYVPDGGTALFDAIGFTIEYLGEKLAAVNEADRPGRVLVVIMTDGEENSSKKFRRQKISEMIKHQRTKYSWEFAFVGASLASIEDAVSFGITRGMAASYDANFVGTQKAHSQISGGISSYRSGKSYTGSGK